MTKRWLVTGGSGFIGTNLVDYLLKHSETVLSLDIVPAQHPAHAAVFEQADIMDSLKLKQIINRFEPTHVVHLAARADLHEKRDINNYHVNTTGLQNMIDVLSQLPSLKVFMSTSTKLVCAANHTPQSDTDFCPTTLYGQSKMLGEKLLRKDGRLPCWCIVRPSSIWGPWSMAPHIPYGRFFQMIARKKYVHPGPCTAPKSFGYVENAVFQIIKLCNAAREDIHQKVFYLSDYEVLTIRKWADTISQKLHQRNNRQLPMPMVRCLAWTGDIMKVCGCKEPPFSSFRLKNMQADTSRIPLERTRDITGPLPFDMPQGVDRTLDWLKTYNYI